MPRRAKSAVIEPTETAPSEPSPSTDDIVTVEHSQANHALNDVQLVGRLAAPCIRRTLPSGDDVVTFRLIVDRLPVGVRAAAPDYTATQTAPAITGAIPDATAGAPTRRIVDSLPCSAWTGDLQLLAEELHPGDVVAVRGSLRRRFRRGPAGVTSLFEVAVTSVARVGAIESAA